MGKTSDLDAIRADFDAVSESQLNGLLVHRHIFSEFVLCVEPYVGTFDGADLADWITRNYVAYAVTGVRRLVDRRKRTRSLVRALENLKGCCGQLTRERMRAMFRDAFPLSAQHLADSHADEMFSFALGLNQPLTSSFTKKHIAADIAVANKSADNVVQAANDWIAHTST